MEEKLTLPLTAPCVQHIHSPELPFSVFDLAAGLSVPSGSGDMGEGELADILICMRG